MKIEITELLDKYIERANDLITLFFDFTEDLINKMIESIRETRTEQRKDKNK